MESNNLIKESIELSYQCIEQCKSTALFCKEETHLKHCMELCLRCAEECEFLTSVFLIKPFTESTYYEKCSAACGNCATECEKYDYLELRKCAELCRKFQLTSIFQTYKNYVSEPYEELETATVHN
jgi:hypothetical protein